VGLTPQAIDKAKEAEVHERLLSKQREQLLGPDQTNFDLTYAVRTGSVACKLLYSFESSCLLYALILHSNQSFGPLCMHQFGALLLVPARTHPHRSSCTLQVCTSAVVSTTTPLLRTTPSSRTRRLTRLVRVRKALGAVFFFALFFFLLLSSLFGDFR
jgi:hypothetical protein